MRLLLLLFLFLLSPPPPTAHAAMPSVRSTTTFSARLVHRFSEELKPVRAPTGSWPDRKSIGYYEMLLNNDYLRHKIRLGAARHQLLFPSHGSKMMSLGNDFGCLHYTWIDIGTPSTSFLVALDAGSDLLWVPCDCIQCAPLSSSYYSNLGLSVRAWVPEYDCRVLVWFELGYFHTGCCCSCFLSDAV